MPDYTIASQVQTPDSMKSISSMVGIARGAQELQRGGIHLQRETQANDERLKLQDFMSNPENFQTNGRIDLDKINSQIPKIAPLTGRETMDKLTTLAGAQTAAIEAKQNLTQKQRAIIAGPIGILGRAGVTDPNVYVQELQSLKAANPDNPDLHKLIDSYSTTLPMVPKGPEMAKKAVLVSQQLISPEGQQASLTPTAGLTNTGGNLQETITTPSVGGNQPSIAMTGRGQPITLGPDQRQSVSINPVTASPMTTSKDAAGNVVGVTQTPTGPGVPQLNPGEAQEIPIRTQQRAAINAAAAKVPEQHFNNQQIIRLAPEAFTGTGSDKLSKIGSLTGVQMLPGDHAGNLQRLGHFMSLQAQANAQAMGAGTDAARAISEQATGSTGWTADAIISTAKVNDALSTGVDLFNRGMEAAIKAKGGNVLAARDFQNAWSQNFDVRAMQLHNAIANGDKGEVAKIVKEVGGRGSPGAQEVIRKAKALEKLSTDGKL